MDAAVSNFCVVAHMLRLHEPRAAGIIEAAAEEARTWRRANPTADTFAVKRALQELNVVMVPALTALFEAKKAHGEDGSVCTQ